MIILLPILVVYRVLMKHIGHKLSAVMKVWLGSYGIVYYGILQTFANPLNLLQKSFIPSYLLFFRAVTCTLLLL